MKEYVNIGVLTDPIWPLETIPASGVLTVPWPE